MPPASFPFSDFLLLLVDYINWLILSKFVRLFFQPNVPAGRLDSPAGRPNVPAERLDSPAELPDVPAERLNSPAELPDVPAWRLDSLAELPDIPAGRLELSIFTSEKKMTSEK